MQGNDHGRRDRGPRSMAGYLALPRPGDIGKAVILVLGFAMGATVTTSMPTGRHLLGAALVWFALEYLAYQARYQWNDIRGFRSDQLHPDRDARGRLPGPVERGRAHIAISATVAVARVAVVGLLALLLTRVALGNVLLVSALAVFAVAGVYELVRSRAGRCRPASRPAGACVALWFVAGGGYCVRGLTGLVLGAGGHGGGIELVIAGAACWFAGMVFVTTRWAVESIPFAERHGDRLIWTADPDAGRGHLLALAHWLPTRAAEVPEDLRAWRPLWARRAWHAPWNVSFFIAISCAWLTGEVLTSGSQSAAEVVLCAFAVLAAWTVIALRPAVVSGVVSGAVLLVAAAVTGPVVVAVPAVMVCALYLVCVHQSLNDVGTLYQRRVRPVFRTLATAVRSRRRSAPVGRAPQPLGPALRP